MKLAQKLAVNYIRARLNLLAVISKKKAAKKAFDIFCTPFNKSRKQAPPIFEQAVPLSFRLNNSIIRGFRWNKGGTKRVLILHGFESSVKNFEVYIKEFIRKNYEVLAFDAPAHGGSDGSLITLPLYIEMITAIHLQFGIIESFMAHSFGGLALAHFIEKLPVGIHAKMALVAPATETTTAIDSFFHFLQLGKGVRYEFEKLIREKNGVEPSYYSISRALRHINIPVLWVHDRQDEVTPFRDVAPVMQEHYHNLSFFITEGLGHKKIYKDNRVVKAVVEFL